MPRYDYRCAAGHETETEASRFVRDVPCSVCDRAAQRLISTGVGIVGMMPTPTTEARIPFSRYLEAQGELVESARKQGVEPPDLWGAAKRRIARGDVQAIA